MELCKLLGITRMMVIAFTFFLTPAAGTSRLLRDSNPLGYSDIVHPQLLKKDGKQKPKHRTSADGSLASLSTLSTVSVVGSRSFSEVASTLSSSSSSGMELLLREMKEDRQQSTQVMQQIMANQLMQTQSMGSFMSEIMKQSTHIMEQNNAQAAVMMAQNQQLLLAQTKSMNSNNTFMAIVLDHIKSGEGARGEKRGIDSADDRLTKVDNHSNYE